MERYWESKTSCATTQRNVSGGLEPGLLDQEALTMLSPHILALPAYFIYLARVRIILRWMNHHSITSKVTKLDFPVLLLEGKTLKVLSVKIEPWVRRDVSPTTEIVFQICCVFKF